MEFKSKMVSKWVGALALASVAMCSQAAPLVANGGFTSITNGNADSWNTGTVGNDPSPMTVSPTGNSTPFSMSFSAQPGDSNDNGTVAQSVDLVSTQSYTLKFFLFGDGDLFKSLSFGNSGPIVEDDSQLLASGWTLYFYVLEGFNTGHLIFSFQGSGTALLDDVTITNDRCPLVASGVCDTNPNPGVPEPGSLLLVGAALAGLAMVRRRKVH